MTTALREDVLRCPKCKQTISLREAYDAPVVVLVKSESWNCRAGDLSAEHIAALFGAMDSVRLCISDVSEIISPFADLGFSILIKPPASGTKQVIRSLKIELGRAQGASAEAR